MIKISGGGFLHRRMYHISLRSWFALDIPQARVFENLFDAVAPKIAVILSDTVFLN
jgi:hypothetical protein